MAEEKTEVAAEEKEAGMLLRALLVLIDKCDSMEELRACVKKIVG